MEKKRYKKGYAGRLLISLFLVLLLAVSACGMYDGRDSERGEFRIENGMAQPMLRWNDLRAAGYRNQGSDILRFCVYVETDLDTDGDGMADLVKVFMQVPRSAAEGEYKAATIYDPTPYAAGYNSVWNNSPEEFYEETEFDFDLLNEEGEKRMPVGEMTTLELSEKADPADWNYQLENVADPGYYDAQTFDYFLIRGFAVADACGIGTYGSEGFEVCGLDQEAESHKCVVEWLSGQRKAFTDKTQNIEIAADWSNGNVAMAGCSYGGTIPFAVATTGVEGLKTIIPSAGIADWYDYTNSQGVPLRFDVHYTDFLAAGNCGGCFTDEELTQLKPGYGSFLWTVSEFEEDSNGDYTPIWQVKEHTDDYAGIKCPALIVQGMNDYNVMTRQADLMMQAFAKAGQPAKLVLHQEAHTVLDGHMVNGELWEETLNKWLSHYLYGAENGIENMPAVTVQSNIDGSWQTYDRWRDFDYLELEAKATDQEETTHVDSASIAETATEAFAKEGEEPDRVTFRELYYSSLDKEEAAKYKLEVPEGSVLFGVPEVRVKLSTDDVVKDGMMITAVLVDVADDGSDFNAFAGTQIFGGEDISTDSVDTFEYGGGRDPGMILEAVQIPTPSKIVSMGWTDLRNPGGSPDSRDYTSREEDLEAFRSYDYTFYMLPAVYTLAPGHHLELILTTWDPYRAFLDEDYQLDPDRDPKYSFYTYDYTVDNSSVKVNLPVR